MASLADATGKPEVFGDSAYADGATRDALGAQGFTVTVKVPPERTSTGLFTKEHFEVDLDQHTVTCPARPTVTINHPTGVGTA